MDLKKFNEALGSEYILALRLHPKIKDFYTGNIESDEDYIDCSDYPSEQELMMLSDILITDYSSIMIEFAVLDKPIIFFVYDLDNYLRTERGFYYDFEKTVPGKLVYSSDELISAIENNDFDKDKLLSFTRTQFDAIDGKSSERVVDFLLK